MRRAELFFFFAVRLASRSSLDRAESDNATHLAPCQPQKNPKPFSATHSEPIGTPTVRGELAAESASQMCWFGDVVPQGNLPGSACAVDERKVARTKETA